MIQWFFGIPWKVDLVPAEAMIYLLRLDRSTWTNVLSAKVMGQFYTTHVVPGSYTWDVIAQFNTSEYPFVHKAKSSLPVY